MDLTNIPQKYHGYVSQKDDNETADEWMKRVDFLLDPGERGNDVYKACFSSTDNPYLLHCGGHSTERLDAVFLDAELNHTTQDNSVLPAYLKLTHMFGHLNLVPLQHSIKDTDAEFHWSKARCLFAGAGFHNWKPLAIQLVDSWPLCPFDPDQTEIEWETENLTAHKNCGWPITVGWIKWDKLVRADQRTPDSTTPPNWMKAACLLHMLSTIRYTPTTQTICLFGMGTMQEVAVDPTTSKFADTKRLVSAIRSHMSHRKGNKKDGYFTTALAIDACLESINSSCFQQREPRTNLPPNLLTGPWTHIKHSPSNLDGFAGHGLELSGAWQAENGVVSKWRGTSEDVMRYDWPLSIDSKTGKLRSVFAGVIPKTYAVSWAYDKFVASFPNLCQSFFGDVNAAAAIFDAPIVASLLRDDIPELTYEYPYVIFQPSNPVPGEDTNQGKSTISLAYARCMVSGLDHELRVPASTSAPDSRAVAAHITDNGTACFGEFVVPSNPSHILCQNNLQTLATGSGVSCGKAYSNESSSMMLSHSVVINSKNCSFRDDMINRSFFFWLDDLSNHARANQTAYTEAMQGKLSLDCKLGLLATIEQIGRDDFIKEVRKRMTGTTSGGLRFSVHKAIAQFIYELRGGTDTAAIDTEIKHQASIQEEHGETAALSGVTQDQQSDSRFEMRTSVMFDQIDEHELADMAVGTGSKPLAVKTLIEEYLIARGIGTKEIPELVQELTGKREGKTVLMIAQALLRDLRKKLPVEDTEMILPGIHGFNGWVLRRCTDRSRQMQVALVNIHEQGKKNAQQKTS